MRSLFSICLAVAAVSLSACGANSGGVTSAGAIAPPAAATVAAIADVTLPPPSVVSPTARTTIDDGAVRLAFKTLDLAATVADTAIAFRPALVGTPAALAYAQALVDAKRWLNAASIAQRAGQADSYSAALGLATQAITRAQGAAVDLKGQ